MKSTNTIWLLSLLSLAVTLAVSCSKKPGYSAFGKQGPDYYASFITNCDSLISKASEANNNHTNRLLYLQGNDPMLPPIIQSLHPIKVKVFSGVDEKGSHLAEVLIMFGVSREGWSIAWGQRDYDYGTNAVPWVLSINTEEENRILFSTNKPPRLGNVGSQ